jgi:RecA/RadA recombinase
LHLAVAVVQDEKELRRGRQGLGILEGAPARPLAAKALREAQRLGQQVVWVDVPHTVDVDFLARCGVGFDALTILRPWDFAHALAMTGDLLRGGGIGAVVFDRISDLLPDGVETLDVALRDWNPVLNRSLCTLIFLTETLSDDAYPSGLPLPFFASARLHFQRQEWLYRRRRVTGFTSKVTVLKNRFGSSGQSALIQVKYTNGILSGDE